MLLVARHAPGGKDIDERHLALAEIRIRKSRLVRQPVEGRKGEGRHLPADERGRQKRRIAGIEPNHEQCRERGEKYQGDKNETRPPRGSRFWPGRRCRHLIPSFPSPGFDPAELILAAPVSSACNRPG